ncbi:MAG: hypothetical protein F9K13_11335 [Candidatus Methylomirabilis oxygeniifera]|uniref:NERD domain-containing protein n=1 Tax=Methylomirabilis oxygeniifera TaxID=671143 RepID=D5MKD0_METO1|nr:MAG: hypothetical protein F9K13_11335 [Candidatus Methylomirabilis oxyfera]CBE69752.1 conserved protein of unknown function [Candidatus Methylomirabilis oxyfera]
MWIAVLVLLIIMIIIIIAPILKHPEIKGLIGERRVREQLRRLPEENYKILNDLTLKGKQGTSQIDHMVISPYGIFVIETKDYGGWIHGKEDSEYWVQTFYKSKFKFRNPIKQNWAHIYAIRENLSEYKDLPYYPIIVFAGKGRLKNLDVTTDVICLDALFETIMKHRGQRKLNDNEIGEIVTTLTGASIKDKQAKMDHISRIKWNVKIRKMKERALICPHCGAQLIRRIGKFSKFYGCSNFPRCQHKQD